MSMSYVLHVWENPVPQSLAEATAIALDAGAERIGQNPGFIVLAGRLTSHFPLEVTHPKGSVWSDERLDGRTEERAWKIGVRRDHVRVISHLVVQANLLGLCVFDRQQGIAWLPGGVVLRSSESAPLRPFKADVGIEDRLSRFEVNAGVQRLARQVFMPHGYVFEEDGDEVRYRLALPDGWICVVPLVWDAHPGFRYSFVFEIRHGRSAEIAALFDDAKPGQPVAGCSAIIHLRDVCPYQAGEFPVESVRRFRSDLEQLAATFNERVVPLLERCRTLEGLERFVNRPSRVRGARDSGTHYAQDIAMAWLVGRPDWDKLAAACVTALDPAQQRERARLERLIEHLQSADRARSDAAPVAVPKAAPSGAQERLAAFSAEYDGSQRAQFASTGLGSADANAAWRRALIVHAVDSAHAPLVLLRDLFVEELACQAGSADDRAPNMHGLTMRLLARGGVTELSLVIKALGAAQLREWAGQHPDMPAAVARDLVAACEHRARSSEYRGAKDAYKALSLVLAPAGAA